jgi:hypothetical protein
MYRAGNLKETLPPIEKQIGGMEYYLGLKVVPGVKIKNPLRQDQHPSAAF